MFKNYLKIALRNLIKYKKYSFINIFGLAIGLASVLLIMLWVQDELSFDKFHTHGDDIYLAVRSELGDPSAATSMSLGPALVAEVPEVINATAYVALPEAYQCHLQYEDKGFTESLGLVDPQFFKIFSFAFISGNDQTSLSDPNAFIITERMAKKYFGTSDAIGKSIQFTILGKTEILNVTGVLANLPKNTHIQRDIFLSRAFINDFLKQFGITRWDHWVNRSARTYILTQSNVEIPHLEPKLTNCERSHLPDQKLENLSYSLLPLEDIHLYSSQIGSLHTSGDIKYIYIFSMIAGVILLIACMNYINLSNALILRRTKEIGIQKIVGAERMMLILQYLGESLFITAIAMALSFILIEFSLPLLNELSGKSLSVNYLNPQFFIYTFLIFLITSILTGFSPAIMMSSLQPIQILNGKLKAEGKGFNLRKGLVIFQFTLSIIIIISTLLVYKQLNYMQNSKLGFDKENIICIKTQGNVENQYHAFKDQILKNPDILSITRSEPMDIKTMGATEGIGWPGKTEKFSIKIIHCDMDYADTYKLEMAEGRFYSDQYPSDNKNAYVLNQAAIEAMEIESPIGNELTVWNRRGSIVGIVKDFHYHSFHHKIEPLIFRLPDQQEKELYFRELSIRVQPHSIPRTLSFLETQWNAYFPTEKFDYYFFDESLNANYHAEQRMGSIFKYFSILAIFIACLGLYGLTAFTIEQKIKDIGVHKVLGASVAHIILLLVKNYIWLIITANIFAWSIAWFAMNKWLQNFAYRIDLSIGSFLLAGLSVLLIAILTVSWQAIRAATANPVEALKYE